MRKILFDTSVIFASSREDHVHFRVAYHWVLAVRERKISAFISAHSLAELYSNLTKYPLPPVIPPNDALLFLQKEVMPHFKPITLSVRDYSKAIDRLVDKSLKGGIVYDSLHVQAAMKKKVDALVTLNSKDFARLVKPDKLRIINPMDEAP